MARPSKLTPVRIFVAMEREAKQLAGPVEVIGIRAKRLPEVLETDTIINIGYCGSNSLPPGTIVSPSKVYELESGRVRKLKAVQGLIDVPCFTSRNFVERHTAGVDCIYDMELFKIAGINCKQVLAIKIVSDNLNEKVCEEFNCGKAWLEVNKILQVV